MTRRRNDLFDGPSLVRFLEMEGLADRIPKRWRRAFRHWRSGIMPTEVTVDRFCVETELLHLDDIPAWVALGWPPAVTEGLVYRWNLEGTRRDLVRE